MPAQDLPKLASLLHYRHLDVSSIKELANRWYPGVTKSLPRKAEAEHRSVHFAEGCSSRPLSAAGTAVGPRCDHAAVTMQKEVAESSSTSCSALADIQASIAELRHYRKLVFQPPKASRR